MGYSATAVSMVMATYNRASLLPQTVNAILDQAPVNFELIIVDDASTDNSLAVLNEFSQKFPCICVIHLPENSGPGAARNAGMAQATGDYIAIMDDDDIPHPERISRQYAYLEKNPESDLVFSPVTWVDEHGNPLGVFPGIVQRDKFPSDPKEVFQLLYLESNKVVNGTAMFRRTTYEQIGGYPNYPWVGEDWFWFMKMTASGYHIAAISEPLLYVRRGKNHNNLMRNKQKAFISQRQVLQMIRQWLKEQNIHEFDHLHRRALSNQIVREARFWGRGKGIFLCLQALLLSPENEKAKQTIREIMTRGQKKLFRRLG